MYAQQQPRHFSRPATAISYAGSQQTMPMLNQNATSVAQAQQFAAVLQQQRQQQHMQHAQQAQHLQQNSQNPQVHHMQHLHQHQHESQQQIQHYEDDEDELDDDLQQRGEAADLYDTSPTSSMPSPLHVGQMSAGAGLSHSAQHMPEMQQQVPEDESDQPLYVNAKQYHRILKRRLARAKLEESLKVSKGRRPYLHESRHKHAMRRPRGQGGRFLTAAEVAEKEREERRRGGGVPVTADRNEGDEFVNMDPNESMLSMHMNTVEMLSSSALVAE